MLSHVEHGKEIFFLLLFESGTIARTLAFIQDRWIITRTNFNKPSLHLHNVEFLTFNQCKELVLIALKNS